MVRGAVHSSGAYRVLEVVLVVDERHIVRVAQSALRPQAGKRAAHDDDARPAQQRILAPPPHAPAGQADEAEERAEQEYYSR